MQARGKPAPATVLITEVECTLESSAQYGCGGARRQARSDSHPPDDLVDLTRRVTQCSNTLLRTHPFDSASSQRRPVLPTSHSYARGSMYIEPTSPRTLRSTEPIKIQGYSPFYLRIYKKIDKKKTVSTLAAFEREGPIAADSSTSRNKRKR